MNRTSQSTSMLLDDLKTKHTTYIKRVKEAVRDKVRGFGKLLGQWQMAMARKQQAKESEHNSECALNACAMSKCRC